MDPVTYALSGFYRDRFFYVVGGLDDLGTFDTVLRAPILCNETAGVFEPRSTGLLIARGHLV
jgi:hypothetical protein